MNVTDREKWVAVPALSTHLKNPSGLVAFMYLINATWWKDDLFDRIITHKT